MVCFSGMGGMIRVGCRLTKAVRKAANSEYRRVTSMSCRSVSLYLSKLQGAYAYPRAYPVYNIASIWTFTGVTYDDLEVWALVEKLLKAAVVAISFSAIPRLCIRIVLLVGRWLVFILEVRRWVGSWRGSRVAVWNIVSSGTSKTIGLLTIH